ncbi:MAG: dTMP kinase [Abditibacteriota bacterium]|nr:dTMP kinase [Abditibacteriota bacterium]
MRGIFITLEGVDGCGKSTLAKGLKSYFESKGREVVLTREPRGKIRELLLNSKELPDAAELLLMEASRSEHTETLIKPALSENKIVICDRYFDSTTAYQGCARGLKSDIIEVLNNFATGGLKPDLTLLLDIDAETGLGRQEGVDRISASGLAFMEKVRRGYLETAAKEPERIAVIDASAPREKVFDEAVKITEERLKI